MLKERWRRVHVRSMPFGSFDPMACPPSGRQSPNRCEADLCFSSVVGLTSAAERDRIERFLYRMKRMDYLSDDLGSAAQLVESAEDGLMRSIIAREIHVGLLRPLCPPVNIRKYDLRPSPHNFLLPLRDDTNYIPRTLFRWLRPNL